MSSEFMRRHTLGSPNHRWSKSTAANAKPDIGDVEKGDPPPLVGRGICRAVTQAGTSPSATCSTSRRFAG